MSPEQQRDRLIEVYGEMAEHTRNECGPEPCDNHSAFRCCDPVYCNDTIQYARRRWDIELTPTGHEHIPLMDPETNACTAPPHTRPICTVHTCAITGMGVKRSDPEWTRKYFVLREVIDRLELSFDILQLEDTA
jgi:hypothetical protein